MCVVTQSHITACFDELNRPKPAEGKVREKNNVETFIDRSHRLAEVEDIIQHA